MCDSRIIENGFLRVIPVCWVNAWLGILVYVHSYEEWCILVEWTIVEKNVFWEIIYIFEKDIYHEEMIYILEIIRTYLVLEGKNTCSRCEPEISQFGLWSMKFEYWCGLSPPIWFWLGLWCLLVIMERVSPLGI